jgi:hypothetical protein
MIPNPWILLGALGVFIAATLGAFLYGRDVGTTSERAAHQGQQIKELKAANAEIDRLNKAARGQEAAQAAALALQGADYEKRLQDAEDARRRDVGAARAGRLIVRVPGVCAAGGDGPAAAPASPAGRSDGAARCELSPAAGGDLLDLIADADRNTRQLGAAQAVIRAYLNPGENP